MSANSLKFISETRLTFSPELFVRVVRFVVLSEFESPRRALFSAFVLLLSPAFVLIFLSPQQLNKAGETAMMKMIFLINKE